MVFLLAVIIDKEAEGSNHKRRDVAHIVKTKFRFHAD